MSILKQIFPPQLKNIYNEEFSNQLSQNSSSSSIAKSIKKASTRTYLTEATNYLKLF